MESIVAREVSLEVAIQWGKKCAEIADREWEKQEEDRKRLAPNDYPIVPPWRGRVNEAVHAVYGTIEVKPLTLDTEKKMLIKCGIAADRVTAGEWYSLKDRRCHRLE
ncbi:MAG: hypothetical protein ABSG67_16530 [Thermoguttaceae bacterium]|jgi:hypothetical protein